MKRVVIVSDLHCGHRVGLTPPAWNTTSPRLRDEADERAEVWNTYSDILKTLQPVDILVANGDLVDGDGGRTGGIELLERDTNLQAEMSAQCLLEARADSVYITRGTPYHTGYSEETEDLVADMVDASEITDSLNLKVGETLFNFRHHIGGSGVPHGRATALLRADLWNQLWADKGGARADVLVRSHVHYHQFAGKPGTLALTTPALQGLGSRYGKRVCEGTVDWGLVYFDVGDDGSYSWEAIVREWIKPHIVEAPQ